MQILRWPSFLEVVFPSNDEFTYSELKARIVTLTNKINTIYIRNAHKCVWCLQFFEKATGNTEFSICYSFIRFDLYANQQQP